MSNEYVWATLISAEDLHQYHPLFRRVFESKNTEGENILSVYLPAVITHAAMHQSYLDDDKNMQWRVVDTHGYEWSVAYNPNGDWPCVVLRAKAPEQVAV